jgi:hypothetical protein
MNEWKQLTYCMCMRRQDLEGGRGIMEQLTQVGNPEAPLSFCFPDIFPGAPTWNPN